MRSLPVLASLLLAGAAAAQAPPPVSYGVWRNPKNSVHVEVKPCGQGVCGEVVWANAKAQADARRGGADQLIGLQLFRDFRRGANGEWRGSVFVPDLNKTFSGTAQRIDETTIRAKGCAFAVFACKSQDWKRIG